MRNRKYRDKTGLMEVLVLLEVRVERIELQEWYSGPIGSWNGCVWLGFGHFEDRSAISTSGASKIEVDNR